MGKVTGSMEISLLLFPDKVKEEINLKGFGIDSNDFHRVITGGGSTTCA